MAEESKPFGVPVRDPWGIGREGAKILGAPYREQMGGDRWMDIPADPLGLRNFALRSAVEYFTSPPQLAPGEKPGGYGSKDMGPPSLKLQLAFTERNAERLDRNLEEIDARARRQMTDGIMTGTEIAHTQGRDGSEAGRHYFTAAGRPADRAMAALDHGRVRPVACLPNDDDRER